jgi:hypothetical protein
MKTKVVGTGISAGHPKDEIFFLREDALERLLGLKAVKVWEEPKEVKKKKVVDETIITED